MSVNLFWNPVVKTKGHSLSKHLRDILAQRYWKQDGSLSAGPIEIGQSELNYLSGVRDAGVEEAAELIDAIKTYGAVEISIHE